MIPDINWDIVDLQVTTDNHIIVRGEGTGTPAGDAFFGTPADGKSFTLMSIDIHEVKNGKVTKSYHIEDWLGALRQVRAK